MPCRELLTEPQRLAFTEPAADAMTLDIGLAPGQHNTNISNFSWDIYGKAVLDKIECDEDWAQEGLQLDIACRHEDLSCACMRRSTPRSSVTLSLSDRNNYSKGPKRSDAGVLAHRPPFHRKSCACNGGDATCSAELMPRQQHSHMERLR